MGLCKLLEICLQWQLPLKKYGILPEGSFFQQMASCNVFTLPQNFYHHVEAGSIIIKKSTCWGFCEKGLLLLESEADDQKQKLVEADLVILATGYKSYQKLKDLFESSSPYHQYLLPALESGVLPLYRECIHPRIPQMAIVGYTESASNLFTVEMEVRWLVCFLAGGFRLPSTKEMEEDIKKWDEYQRKHSGCRYKKPSVTVIHIWYNDKLCKDMGCRPWRRSNWVSELFLPYGPAGYSNLKI